MSARNKKEEKALKALSFVIPLLSKYHFRWVITGGFACYVYGVKRALTDIDIDIDTDRNDASFQSFLEDLRPFITQDIEHFVDENYDNYNVEITYEEQVVDICPMAQLKIFDASKNAYKHFYENGFPLIEKVNFHGMALPLLSKNLIIKNKEMLVWQRESDHRDIEGLRKLKNSS